MMNEARTSARPSGLTAFLRKEWRETLRQSRIFIILAPLFIFAILNPIMIKLLPTLLGSQMAQLGQLIQVGAPDAIQGYFKNIGDISLLVFVLALMGTIAEERAAGAYLIPFSRRVQRWQAVAAKFAVNIAVLAVGLIGSALLARYYVGVLFSVALPAADFLRAALIDLSYYCCVLGVLLFFSSVFKRGFAAGIATLVLMMMMPVIGLIPGIGRYLPHNLLGAAITVATGGFAPASTGIAVAVAVCLGLLGAIGAGVALERAEL